MHGSRTARIAAAVLIAAAAGCSDDATDPAAVNSFYAILNGASVRPTATSSGGSGNAAFVYTGSAITFTVNYSGLGANPTSARVHLAGPTQTNATASLDLCGAGSAPACPAAAAGTVTGTASVAPGTLDNIVNAMRGFGAYVVINTGSLTQGEIRGNIVNLGSE